jgi:hypothetical protein
MGKSFYNCNHQPPFSIWSYQLETFPLLRRWDNFLLPQHVIEDHSTVWQVATATNSPDKSQAEKTQDAREIFKMADSHRFRSGLSSLHHSTDCGRWKKQTTPRRVAHRERGMPATMRCIIHRLCSVPTRAWLGFWQLQALRGSCVFESQELTQAR